MRRYAVDVAPDDPVILQNLLQKIADEGGRPISVIWRPERSALQGDGGGGGREAGYVIVSEYENATPT
jgi:hypothetical protein